MKRSIEIFAKHLPQMQQQLGHRVADAHGLVAGAYDLLGKDAGAAPLMSQQRCSRRPLELQRRYPDLVKIV